MKVQASELGAYPLSLNDAETRRLNEQACFLYDPSIECYVKQAQSCLEIGCGVGSNLPWLKRLNPQLVYTGVDQNPEAIRQAVQTHGSDPKNQFFQQDV
ncbi:MAG: class I SAM-dependent methyltransferase, partial [Bdellovibrionia bacterium]